MNNKPVLILGLLLVVLLVVIFKTSQMNGDLAERLVAVKAIESEAKQIDELKSSWERRGNAQKRMDAALSHPALKQFEINKEQKKDIYVVEIPLIDKRGLDALTGKVLNETLKIETFEIVRLDENNASVKLEVRL